MATVLEQEHQTLFQSYLDMKEVYADKVTEHIDGMFTFVYELIHREDTMNWQINWLLDNIARAIAVLQNKEEVQYGSYVQ